MQPLHVPNLVTLRQTPSWYNAHGRLDRSACIEVRVSEVRRLAGSVCPKPRIWPDMKKGRLPVRPLPHERSARNADGRVATGRFTVTAEQLHILQSVRLPRRLAGDRRTIRANAMRPPQVGPNEVCRIRRPRNSPPDAVHWDLGLDINPNHGAGRTKLIGLPAEWAQPLRIEQWIYPGRLKPAYFLICPGWALARRLAELGRKSRAPWSPSGVLPLTWLEPDLPPSRDPRYPPLSTCGKGRKDPLTVRCPQRCYKLLMVQCTEAEARDADAAVDWYRSLPTRVREHPHYRPAIARVLDRYGPILPPRILLCPRCCGVRYGNDPENNRQSWRRLAGKSDARPAKRIVTRSNNEAWARKRRRNKGRDARE